VTLQTGRRLGPYEILGELGAGGMGEVYRALDTRLDRTVAVKILPERFSSSPDFKQRFQREARAVSSLQHPHICTLFDVGSQNCTDFLVMEYLEGETLAERLKKGPLRLEQALKIAIEIAGALDKAHREGIIHRDLKPGNIMLTRGGAKLMDFGLARPAAAASVAGVHLAPLLSNTVTVTTPSPHSPLTSAGALVGTIQYMSPEQIEGKEADARSDIFAFGAVLYEMATRKPAFEGKSQISIASAILEKDPAPVRSLRPTTPPSLDRAIRTCLAKDPDERWQSCADLKQELQWIAQEDLRPAGSGGSGALIKNSRLAWAVAAGAILAIVILALWQLRAARPSRPVVAQIVLPAGLKMNSLGDASGAIVISPDGSRVVFSAADSEGGTRLYVRAMDATAVTPLNGTDGATFPFWSPDSRSVGFFSGGKMKRIDISAGTPLTICNAAVARGGSWGRDGTIIFTPGVNTGIWKVAATGGTPVEIIKVEQPQYTTYRWPWMLPDSKHFLYLAANHNQPNGPDNKIFYASLDGKENRPLFQNAGNAIYSSGYLLYARGTALMAQAFDPDSGRISGDPMVLNDAVQLDGSIWRATITASDAGSMVYESGGAAARLQLTWYDRKGKQLSMLDSTDSPWQVQLSPDQKKLAVDYGELQGWIAIHDLSQKISRRLTFGDETARDPVWSPDGSQIAYARHQQAGLAATIVSKPASGAAAAVQLMPGGPELDLELCDWSRDGRNLLFQRGKAGVGDGQDLWVLPLNGDRKPYPYFTAPGDQTQAQFSPDGRWVAFSSNESGRFEVYVAPFPWSGAKWQISNTGAQAPRWRSDGKELFMTAGGDTGILVAPVNGSGSDFEAGEVRRLFRMRLDLGYQGMSFAPSRNGQQFVVITHGTGSSSAPILVENWTSLLTK
jgi:eukaryotic-like serine/threonine-protein kinase